MFALSRPASLPLPTGVIAPRYDLEAIAPSIVHIGVGGFHRSHFARYTHDLMNTNVLDCGIIGAGLRAGDVPLLRALQSQDGLYTLVERSADGEAMTVIGSIIDLIDASASTEALLAAIARPQILIVSITVSEAGYELDPATKVLDLNSAAIRHDIANPRTPRTVPGVLVEAYRQRHVTGLPAFTALTCDNIQHNGRVLRDAILTLARQTDPTLGAWIADSARFPSSMVDRITPAPTEAEIEAFRAKTGIADKAPIFSESFRHWVIEDDFATGRPDWSKVGAQFVKDVAPYEAMKLRLLNCSHLVIAGLGALSGYETVEQTMRDAAIRRAMQRLMDEETGPLLAPVPGIDLAHYKATLIARFANPAIRDTVRRINTDAPINLLLDPLRHAVAAYAPMDILALGLAAWCKRASDQLRRGEAVAGANANSALQAHAGDPLSLLSITSIFGDLGRHARVRDAVQAWLQSFDSIGIAGTFASVRRSAAD